ncbi:MAG: DUF6427 family protein [Bacteroidota bacterium]|nr:DUF6427 family protein [Bacteroidota bacterium]
MVAIFREKSAVSVFWLIALSIVIHGHFIVAPPQVVLNDNDVWMKTLLSPLSSFPALALLLLYHIIVIVQALRLSTVLNHLRMFPKVYFIPALCYLILTSLYPAWNNITPALLINFIIIWLFSLIARLYSSPQSKPLIYNIGFLVGTVAFIYSPFLFLLPVCFIALTLLRAFRFNEWMILLLGILTPAYLLASVLFLNNNLDVFVKAMPHFHPHVIIMQKQTPLLIAFAASAVLLIWGIAAWQSNTGRMIIQTRRCWSVLFIMFLFSIPLLFVLKGEDTTILLLSTVPAAALSSNAFVYSKNEWLQTVVFWLLIVTVIFNNWFWLKT